jgi:hypothetical protein
MSTREPYYADDLVTLHLGDCLDVMRTLEADSVDAIVTDPPAGIGFMDREWDDFRRARNPADAGRDNVFGRTSARGPEYGRGERRQFVEWLTERMAESLRVLKPGGHALVWSIPRTSHWTAWALEDAGLDIRDCILHLFGSGFAKSLDVSKAIDRAAGAEREVIAEGTAVRRMIPGASQNRTGSWIKDDGREFVPTSTAPATEDAVRWEGWGTALKPGQEIWWLVRKPLAAGTVAANVLRYGTGALNVAACRVAHASAADLAESHAKNPGRDDVFTSGTYGSSPPPQSVNDAGRWPPNIVFTHSASCEPIGTRRVASNSQSARSGYEDKHTVSGHGLSDQGSRGYGQNGTEVVETWRCADDCPVGELDRQSGVRTDTAHNRGERHGSVYGGGKGPSGPDGMRGFTETGGASRFYPTFRYQAKAPASERPRLEDGTAHETVKSLGLVSWLVKLITPPGGTVLDMFAGSGPVGEVCVIGGFKCVLIEQNPKSAELIMTRLRKPIQPDLFGGGAA